MDLCRLSQFSLLIPPFNLFGQQIIHSKISLYLIAGGFIIFSLFKLVLVSALAFSPDESDLSIPTLINISPFYLLL